MTLPQNYQGKTLTIAQSTDSFGGELQEPSTTVWPCGVTLYCGYAYESALVAESVQTAVPAALSFAAGTLLLALFLWQAFQGRLALDALCGCTGLRRSGVETELVLPHVLSTDSGGTGHGPGGSGPP